ncbi:hypothetical protein HHI36_010630 [Cryptolaemus montrouzieri]|uniref:Uncharacterized protein n=1 Tax=Cryptolaemus montrouzieri TaxID=559131 RepID=A0ABD2MJC2_9CUCU
MEQEVKEKGTKQIQMIKPLLLQCYKYKLSPKLNAFALYYRMKLKVHNFTLFNLKTQEDYCFFLDELEEGLNADEFASVSIHFIDEDVDKMKYNHIFYTVMATLIKIGIVFYQMPSTGVTFLFLLCRKKESILMYYQGTLRSSLYFKNCCVQ